MMEGSKNVVIDNGSASIKAGFAGELTPRCVIPNVVGVAEGQKISYAGEEALAKRGVLNIKNPIVRGVVDSWDGMQKVNEKEIHQ